MRTKAAVFGALMVVSCFCYGQGNIIFLNPEGSFPGSGSSYFTGSGTTTTPPDASGRTSDLRARAFSGSGYFTSSGEVIDSALALRLGDGVNPLAAANAAGQVVPEPSTLAVWLLGVVLVGMQRRSRSKARAA